MLIGTNLPYVILCRENFYKKIKIFYIKFKLFTQLIKT